MTLILNCITREYVLQVSDRRLVNLVDGKPCKSDENKAVDFCGRMAFAYTGLANLPTPKPISTDLWLADALVGCTSIPDAVEAIRIKATNCFTKFKTPSVEWKRHAFVGIGWIQFAYFEPVMPAICLISNFHDKQLNELTIPLEEFNSVIAVLDDSSPRDFIVVAIGQPVDRKIARQLNRNLSSCIKHSSTVGPKSFLRYMVDAMRNVANSNEKVGRDLMAVSIPKQALTGSNYIRMEDGSPALVTLFSPPERSARTFLYIPEGQYKGIDYGPNLVYGNSILNGYSASSSEDGIKMNVSARIRRLEPGAKAGLIIYDDQRAGQFISMPKIEHPAIQASIEKVVNEFMLAMVSKDCDKAFNLYSTRAKSQTSISSVKEMIEGSNSSLFDGYRSVQIKSVVILPQPKVNPETSQYAIAEVGGVLTFASGKIGNFDVTMEKENNDWKIFLIRIKQPFIMTGSR
jgi:hypothetical protein